jgi:predicted nucleic acid-binding Zn ribbon protein
MSDPPLAACPNCGAAVRRAVSRFCACTTDSAGDSAGLDSQIKDFESEGKWSHAAEMADKAGLQERAMDNYRKAGYNF